VPSVISKPGDYRLAKNLTLAKGSDAAIVISASNVNLDFNGYTLTASGTTNSAGGIGVWIRASRVTVRNGTIVGFGDAVAAINATTPLSSITIEDLTCQTQLGAASLYIDSSDTTLLRCHVTNPSGAATTNNGIYLNASATVEDCTVSDLIATGSTVLGFVIHDGPGTGQATDVLRHCVVSNLSTTGSSSHQGGVWYGSANTVVDDCYFYNLDIPVAQGTGQIIVKNSTFRACGSSLGAGNATDGGNNTFVP
jgi:hypothetical protein